MSNRNRKFVTLGKDFTFINRSGEETYEKGKRFAVTYERQSINFLSDMGELVLSHFYGYGQALVIPNMYLKNIKPEQIWN